MPVTLAFRGASGEPKKPSTGQASTSKSQNSSQGAAFATATKKEQQKDPLKCPEIPARPWLSISADLFEFNGTQYLITTDRYSNVFELDILMSTTTRAVINKLKPHLARYGLPDQLTTDTGKQFDCAEFQKLKRLHGILDPTGKLRTVSKQRC